MSVILQWKKLKREVSLSVGCVKVRSTHWIDQCHKFKVISPDDRMKVVKDNHECFSCLKKAGRAHNSSDCSGKNQCTEKEDDTQCKYYHHPLLHSADYTNSDVVASAVSNRGAVLPVVSVDIIYFNCKWK